MVEVDTDRALVDGAQKTVHGLKVQLPQSCKLAEQLRRRVTQLRQILVAIGKSDPVIAGKGNASFRGCGLPIVVECYICGAGSRVLAAVERPVMNLCLLAAGLRNNMELFVGDP